MDLHSTHSTPVKMRTGHRGSFDSLRSSSSSSTFSESETARERDGLEAATPKATNKSNHFNTNNNSKKTVFEATGTGTGLASPFWNRVFPWSNKSPIAKPAPLAASTITQVAADETIAETDKDTAENIEHARSVRRVKSALAFGNQERKPSEEDEQFEDERGRRHKHDGPLLSLSNNSAWARPRSRAQSVNSPAGSRLPIPASASTSFAPALALHPARPPSSTSSHTTNGFGKGVDSLTSASTSTSSNPTTSDFWNPPYQSSADPTTPTSDTKRGLLFSSSASSQAIFPKSAVDAFWKQHSSPLGSVSGGADGNMDAHSPASFMKEQFFSPRSSPSSSMCAKSTHIPDTESDLMVPALAPAAEKLEPSPNSSIEQQQRPQSSQPAQYTQKSSQQPPTEQAPRAPTRSSWPASSHVSPHALTPLHAYMTMSKTGTLDTLAPDALVALPDVSTDLLESDIAALEMLASGVPLPDSPISVQVVGASPRFRLDEALVVSPLRKGRGSPLARRASEGSLGGASRVGMPTVFGAAAPRYAPILVPQQQFQQQQQSGGEEVLVSLQSPVNGGLRGISSPRGVGMGGGWMSPQGGQVGVYRGGPAAPSAAMVELHSVFSTPGSVPRYSERDVQAIKRDMRLQFEKEFELAQVEVAELERKRAEAVEGTRRIQATLKEWEGFMREMIAKKEQDDARARQDVTALRGLLDKTSQERDAKAKELEELHARHRALRLDLEDEREAREKVSAERDAALGAVQEAGERYEMLKAHAEDKLESANVEIARVRAGLEKEIAALRIKVSRAELHVASLEKSVESKTAENAELTKICDDLLLQIENATGP